MAALLKRALATVAALSAGCAGDQQESAMKKRGLVERLSEFNKLSPTEQVEARIAWLEWKMVEVLWVLINVTSLLAGGVATWFVSEAVGSRSLWLLVPVFLLIWLVVGWRVQRQAFRGAPPRIDFIDP